MAITLDGTTGITAPGVTDTGNLSVTGTSTLTGAATSSAFIPTGSTVPANGMYLSAANTLNLATNTTNQVSISSAGIVTGTAGNLMLVQGTAQASTSGTSIDFTSIPSWVKRITVMLNGVSTNGTSNLLIQIGSGSITSTGYASQAVQTATTTTNNSVATNGFLVTGAMAATLSMSGIVQLCLIGSNTWVESGIVSHQAVSNIDYGSGASPALGGALDRIRFTTVNGTDTFDAGTINIQYE